MPSESSQDGDRRRRGPHGQDGDVGVGASRVVGGACSRCRAVGMIDEIRDVQRAVQPSDFIALYIWFDWIETIFLINLISWFHRSLEIRVYDCVCVA